MTDRSPPPLADSFRAVSGALGIAAAVVGAGVLAGWILGLPRLLDYYEAAPEAKFNSGVCLILCGLSLWLHRRAQPSRGRRRVANALAAWVVAIAALTLVEMVGGWDLGIDNLVVREPAGALGAFSPGRMSPIAAAIFLLYGAALLWLDARSRRGLPLASAPAVVAALGSLFVASGYLYGVEFFWGPGAYARVAPPIVIGQLLLAIGVMISRPDVGVTAVLVRPGLGGRSARRLVPVVLALPLVIGITQVLAVRAGWTSEAFALAVATTAVAAITGALVLTTGRVIEEKEAEGTAATEELRANEARLDEIVRAVPFGAHLYELQAGSRLVFTGYSPSADRILGIDHRPLVGRTLEEAFPGLVGTEIPDTYRRVAQTGESWSQEQVTYDEGSVAGAFDVRAVNTGPGRMAAFFADITERKRAEEKIAIITKAVESTSDAIGISDAQGHHFYQNRALSDLLGYATAEELESAGGGSAAVRDPAVAQEMFERIMSSRSWAGELEMVTKSGRVFPAYERADAIVDSDGHLVGLIGIISDLTERKRAESIVQARQRLTDFAASHTLGELMQYALDQVCAQVDSPIGFFHFVEADQHTLSLQAWSTGTLAGMCTAEGSGRHYDVDEAGVWVECVRQRRPVVHNDYAGLPQKKGMPDGHATVVREMVFPIVRNERIVAILGTGNKAQDYTEDDVAQASRLADLAWDIVARKRAEEALRESEARYALTLDAVNDGLWDWNVQTGDALFSPRYYALLGYDDREFTANYANWRLLVHPEDIDQVEKQLGLGVESGAGFTIDLRMKLKSGGWRWLSTRGSIVERDAAGRALRLVGTLSDITERQRAEEALRDLNATLERRVADRTVELAASVKELEAFSYSVSHDLRAPLRSVDGFSRILLDEFAPTLDPAAQRYLGLVRKNAQQMGHLVDDLLSFSRLGRQPLRKARLEPAELVRECLKDLEAEYGALAGTVTVGTLAPCYADPALLRQVWLNLLANACKYTRKRDPAAIRVECRDEGGRAVYVVSDNGVGFDMAYVAKLFGVFQRLHRAEDYEGTGVGLALVQRIVHRHGGRIWAEAVVDRGATFSFTLGEEMADGRERS